VVVLAETPNFSHGTGHRPKVTAALQAATNNEWEMTVAYGDKFPPLWFPLCVLGTVLLAFFISFLVYTLLTQTLIYKKDLAEKNDTLIQNARASAKTEREFNDFIAHEVRNPLSAAMSAASFISSAVNEREPLTTVEDQQAVQDDITIIESSLQFVNDLLRNMLDFHRATSSELHLETTATDVQRDILEPVAAMLYRRYDNYQVIVDCPKDLYIMTDRLRLKQIVLNLGRNSAKFVETGFVRFKAEVIDDNVTLSVEDSGPGIPEEKRRHLYDRFQESLDTLSQGTGIGLNLCLKLIHLMEGKIWLDESYHSGIEGCPGARFVIELNTPPLTLESWDLLMEDGTEECNSAFSMLDSDNDNNSPQPLRSMSCTTPVIEELPENLSALFVDDDMILRKLFVRAVKKICPTWTIQEAGNGETALQMAGSKHFDLIFLDQYMTSVDKQLLGTETAHALRAKGFDGVICGVSANDMGYSFIKAGANAFVSKPFPCKAAPLTKELRHILSSKRSGEETSLGTR
jgi:signal transduction histidine kinase/CheY-like chemotaxis protein